MIENENCDDLYLVNETTNWSFKLNPTVEGVRQLGAGKKIKIRSDAERKIALALCKKFAGKMAVRKLTEDKPVEVLPKDQVIVEPVAPPVIEEPVVEPEPIVEDVVPIEPVIEIPEEEIIPEEPEVETPIEEPVEEPVVENEVTELIEPVLEVKEVEVEVVVLDEPTDVSFSEVPETTNIYDEPQSATLVGKVYMTSVSGKQVRVKIIEEEDRDDGYSIYKAINLATGRKITLDSSKKTLVLADDTEEMKLSDVYGS